MDLKELKKHCDIYEVAIHLGYRGDRTGLNYQGDCPSHISVKGKCLTIYPSSQSFYCFHCNAKSDVIDLVRLFKKCDFKEAVIYLAKYIGEKHPELKNQFSDKALIKCIEEIEERDRIFNMLTEAVEWYHQKLLKNEKVQSYLKNHYGFSEELIKEQKIGYAPETNGCSELAQHLVNKADYKKHLAETGLFNFRKPSGSYYDHFQDRLMFPYWKNNKVVYLAGRILEFNQPQGGQIDQ